MNTGCSGKDIKVERNVYPRGVVSVNYHNINPAKRIDLVQSGHRNVTCSLHDIAEDLFNWH